MVRRALVAPPSFSWKTTCLSTVLLLAEVAGAAVTFILYYFAPVRRGTVLFSALLHLSSIPSGSLGLSRSTPPVVLSLSVAVGTSAVCAIAGGICIIFAVDADVAVANHLDESLALVDAAERDKLVVSAERVLYCTAIVLLLGSALHAVFGWHLHRVVGEKRGAVAFLQAFSVITLPFSALLIMGGQYVVDTATLASAPYTGIVIFSSGLLFLAIGLLAFVGANFEYRRLLSICYLSSVSLGASVVGLSIAYFAMRGAVHDTIVQNWSHIRLILPPTSRGFYDRDQFAATMRSYLKVVACVGIGAGIFILGEANACMTLLHHTSIGKRLFARDQRAANASQVEAAGGQAHARVEADKRLKWVLHFAASKRRQRIAMRVVVAAAVLAVAFISALMCASVVFAAKCNSMGSSLGSSSFSLLNASSAGGIEQIAITNSFARGYLSIVPSGLNDGNVAVEMFGVESSGSSTQSSGSAKDFYKLAQLEGSVGVSLSPVDRTRVLWLDGSCQRVAMDVQMPRDDARSLLVRSNTSVNINTPDAASPLTLRRLSVETDQGSIALGNVDFVEGQVEARSNAGSIVVDAVRLNTGGDAGLEKSASLYSALGPVRLTNATLSDCDLHVETGAGTIQMSAVDSTVTAGRSFIHVKSSSGTISADDIRANWIVLANEHGDVSATSLVSEGSSAFMGRLEVTAISGNVEFRQLYASGNVHIETASGSVKVQLASFSYVGMFYLRSESGVVSIRAGEYSSDAVVESETLSDGRERHGSINCDIGSGSCLSFGDLHVRTSLGDIEVVVGCDSPQCG